MHPSSVNPFPPERFDLFSESQEVDEFGCADIFPVHADARSVGACQDLSYLFGSVGHHFPFDVVCQCPLHLL